MLKVVIAITIVVAAILLFAASKPNTFRVKRSIQIHAPAEKVFALINDFRDWPQWAPQDREDSSMQRTYSGAASGVDAVSDWSSRGSAGRGRMTIVESIPAKKVSVKVDFIKPFEAHNLNEFALEPQGASTNVTWSMQGTNLYMMKVMGVFLNMDKVMGKHFEDGLANLKAAAEQPSNNQ
jgi:carbon monoxide dehydrogenase subunit G